MHRTLKIASFLALLAAIVVAVDLAVRADVALPAADEARTYRDRRDRLLAELARAAVSARGERAEGPLGTVVVLARAGKAPEGEHDTDFRQESDFYYLTGIVEPGAAVVLSWNMDARPERPRGAPQGWQSTGVSHQALYLPAREPRRVRWEGEPLHKGTPGIERLRFDEVHDADVLGDALAAALAGASKPVRLFTASGRFDGPGDLPAGVKVESFRRATAALRLVKDAGEIALLRRAIDITSLALCEAMRSCEPGWNEYRLEATIEYVFRREGAERCGFPSIVGSGPNSCVLHYSKNRRAMRAGDLVVCDVGAEYGRYTADVTRTFPVSGKFTARQREVYEAVLAAQEAGIAAVRPGATVAEVHAAAQAVLKQRGLDRYFFHGTSHWLGLDVHDVGAYATKLAPGMVLTVEPGAYIADEELGVRIEDDVLVTEDGHEVLSKGAPRHPADIEALMSERGVGNLEPRPFGPLAPVGPKAEPEPAPGPRRPRRLF